MLRRKRDKGFFAVHRRLGGLSPERGVTLLTKERSDVKGERRQRERGGRRRRHRRRGGGSRWGAGRPAPRPRHRADNGHGGGRQRRPDGRGWREGRGGG